MVTGDWISPHGLAQRALGGDGKHKHVVSPSAAEDQTCLCFPMESTSPGAVLGNPDAAGGGEAEFRRTQVVRGAEAYPRASAGVGGRGGCHERPASETWVPPPLGQRALGRPICINQPTWPAHLYPTPWPALPSTLPSDAWPPPPCDLPSDRPGIRHAPPTVAPGPS